MTPVRVHIAVLSVAQSSGAPSGAAQIRPPDGTMENIVADKATGAGHLIAGYENVRDSEAAIHANLVGWIDDPDVDVVLVVGDSERIGRVLAPLTTEVLTGFADLLRMLAYREIGDSATLSTAAAARCGDATFVFVLPANANAIRAAMDKLILPQLDPSTQPKNLISSIPRLRAAVTKVDSVPVAIRAEKTATGAGLSPKLPAERAPVHPSSPQREIRRRSSTGVNVIVRTVEDPTKPIERVKLEEQLALSKDDDAPTRARIPTGRRTVETQPLDVSKLRAPAKPAPKLSPLPSIRARETTKPADPAKAVDKPHVPSTIVAIPKPKPKGDANDATKPLDLGRLPKVPPGAEPIAASDDDSKPVARIPLKTATAKPKVDAAEEAAPRSPRVRHLTPPPPPPGSFARAARVTPPVPSTVAPELDPETLDLDPEPEVPEPPVTVQPAPQPADAAPDRGDADADDEPAPPPRRRPTEPPPVFEVPLASSGSDLPRGSFAYPAQRRSKWPLVLALILVSAALGAGAMYLLNRKNEPATIAQVPPDAAAASAAEAPGDAGEIVDATEPDASVATVEPDAGVETIAEPPPAKRAREPKRPRQPKQPAEATVTPTPPVEKRPDRGVEPGCDEVACVLDKYARPCCARYRPQGESFQPSSTAQLGKPQIKAGVDKMRPKVLACAEQFEVKGTVKLSISVDPDGNVKDLSVVTTPDGGLGECVASALRKAKFVKTTNGGSFTYPFVF
ncbi:MAG TPA: molybdopterin-binding protein [Kofleriaceae bacterium]|nr:molybdopterin-binding protein [Kofleriaceae bacterium]